VSQKVCHQFFVTTPSKVTDFQRSFTATHSSKNSWKRWKWTFFWN